LSEWGYRAFAIDIPPSGIKDDKEAIQWLTDVIDTLHLKNFVIISPSMSGRFSLPYIFQSNGQTKLVRGFVPIAPVGTSKFHADDYKQLKVPTLIVHGENDIKFESAFKQLKQIPKSEILLIKKASHASFVEKPIEFHNALRQFLYKIYRSMYNKRFEDLHKNSLVSNTTKLRIKHSRKSQQ